jgi:pimeloyl-ACP methyl ester carboxylesterase
VDGNQGGFANFTLTRTLAQISAVIARDRPTTLIGSSLGGLIAAWAAEKQQQVNRLILLAPAFDFRDRHLARLGESQLKQWQSVGSMPIYHYGEKRLLDLNYSFVEDLSHYPDSQLQRALPTLIVHGTDDEVIQIESSRNYAANRPWVKLIEVNSDHALTNVLPELWQAIEEFCDSSLNLDKQHCFY